MRIVATMQHAAGKVKVQSLAENSTHSFLMTKLSADRLNHTEECPFHTNMSSLAVQSSSGVILLVIQMKQQPKCFQITPKEGDPSL